MAGGTLDLQGRAQEKDLDPPEIQKDGVNSGAQVDKEGQINEKGCGELEERRDEEF